MARHRLDNYLKAYRKRLGLTQDDVASLLGLERGLQVSRYERGVRTPTLEKILAFEAVLAVPVRELFAGKYERAQRSVTRRAGQLLRRLSTQRPGAVKSRRLRAVSMLAGVREPLP